MTTLTNSFEGGTSGTTISAANSGGASGNAFDTVSIGASATDIFSGTHAAHGVLACSLSTPASATTSFNQWSTSMGSQAQVWFRIYLYLTANPASSFQVFEPRSAGSQAAAIIVQTSGTVKVSDASGGQITVTTTTIPVNQWFRIEGFVTGSASAGQTQLKLFTSPDSTIPAETDTSTATHNTAGTLDTYRFGVAASIASIGPFWMDSIGLSNTGPLGPSGAASRRGTSVVPSLIAAGAI